MTEKLMLLTKEQILAADDLPYEIVDVPEWGGKVKVRTMTGAERDEFEQEAVARQNKNNGKSINTRALVVSFTVVDDAGNRLFTIAEAERLGTKSGKVLDRLFWTAERLNGTSSEEVIIKN